MRSSISDFSLANPIYQGATVTFYTVSGGVKTSTRATLYAAMTGTAELTNPQTLDSSGKFAQPVYTEVPVIASISGLTVADHDTGVILAVLSSDSLQAKIAEFLSVADYGAGDGVTNDVTAFQNTINSTTDGTSQAIYVPRNAYVGDFTTLSYGTRNIVFIEQGEVTYSITGPSATRVGVASQYGSLLGQWIKGSLLMYGSTNSASTSVLRVRSDTTDSPLITNTAYIERIIDHDSAISNPHALRVNTQINVDTVSNEWAISGDVQTSSDGTGNVVSVSGVSTREAASTNNTVFAGHFQTKDDVVYAAATDVSPAVGVEINIAAQGLDHPTANNNHGRRLVLDLIAHGVSAYGAAGQNAEIGRGLVISTENDASGAYFRTALHIVEQAANANTIATAIRIDTNGAEGIRIVGAHTTADILMSSNSSYGLICNGTYTNAAIRLADNNYIGLRTNNTIKLRHNTSSGEIEFVSTATARVSFDMDATPVMKLNGTQVVATRKTGYTNAMTGSADRATAYDTSTITTAQLAGRVMALLEDLTSHGLIGT